MRAFWLTKDGKQLNLSHAVFSVILAVERRSSICTQSINSSIIVIYNTISYKYLFKSIVSITIRGALNAYSYKREMSEEKSLTLLGCQNRRCPEPFRIWMSRSRLLRHSLEILDNAIVEKTYKDLGHSGETGVLPLTK